MTNTAALARAITWAASKQSYLTARLLADRDLSDDCLRAYAYFRWADDVVDGPSQSLAARDEFIARQKMLVDSFYHGNPPIDLCPEEQILADLIAHDRGPESGLGSFIHNFMKVIEFDAHRRGRLVTRAQLTAYMSWLATAVMDGIQYFIGNGHPYPKTPDRSTAVMGAHLAHMLRDTLEDLPVGIINIPVEDMPADRNPLELVESTMFRLWVKDQVQRARSLLQAGHRYIDTLEVLRCKIAGAWYCARFEWFLDAIQRDGYLLRQAYPERNSLPAWARMAWLGLSITMKHFTGRFLHGFSRPNPQVMAGTKGNEYSR